jgi:beta-1,4-mannosyl-glycoprotein beta-1,4-N-acetylglucosaminyltransferase
MKVYDCFTFYNELDLLDIRLNELNEVVDYFVIVEGEKTFQGNDKKMFFTENKDRYQEFLEKIIYVVVPSEMLSNSNPWDNEKATFNYVSNGILGADDEDVIMLSALDEIPSKDSVRNAVKSNAVCRVEHDFFYFYLNTKYWTVDPNRTTWHGTCVGKYREVKDKSLYDWFGSTRCYGKIIHGGWHFSFLGDEKKAVEKVRSYSHSEFNYITEQEYKEYRDSLRDPLGRNITGFYSFVDLSSLPEFVQKNQDKYEIYLRKQ